MTNEEREEFRALVREELAACGIHPGRPAPLPTCTEEANRGRAIVSMVTFEVKDAGPDPADHRARLNTSRFVNELRGNGLRLVPEDLPTDIAEAARTLMAKHPSAFDAKHLRSEDWLTPEPPTAA